MSDTITKRKDPATTIEAADRLLETLVNPLHRQIIENYRRHAILENTGWWEGIFDENSTIEHPVYEFAITGYPGVVVEGAEGVKDVYRQMAANEVLVIVVEDEQLMVSDWGFASESMFNTYMRGSSLVAKDIEVPDPDGYYILRQKFAMMWPYDRRGRMIGEHVYENPAFLEILQIPEEEYLTIGEVRGRLAPLLRPLPEFDPDVV